MCNVTCTKWLLWCQANATERASKQVNARISLKWINQSSSNINTHTYVNKQMTRARLQAPHTYTDTHLHNLIKGITPCIWTRTTHNHIPCICRLIELCAQMSLSSHPFICPFTGALYPVHLPTLALCIFQCLRYCTLYAIGFIKWQS